MPPLFRPLVEQACIANPLIFDIPYELQRNEVLPGMLRVGYCKFLPKASSCIDMLNMGVEHECTTTGG